jgi:cyclomaltodextrinase / maltogenic alpha-amylase / neopullulanase
MDDFIFGTLSTDELRIAHLTDTRGGITHTHQRNPRDPLPDQAVEIHLSVGPAYPFDRAWVYWTNDGTDPDGLNGTALNGHATPLEPVNSEWDTFLWGYVRRFRGELPPQRAGTVVRYRLSAGGNGQEILADHGTYYGFYVDNDPPPAWAEDAIIYQVFVDRFFSPASDFPTVEAKPSLKSNGTLPGIVDKLDYIARLGVNCLWLTPIFPSPSYHGYDATSFFDINPRLGDREDFKELIEQAHGRGMRILMDFVPNHWSSQHPTFVEATQNRESPYFKWYTFERWPDEYKRFFTSRGLPQINLRHGPAREHVLEAARYWLEFGVDGYRVDYCIGPTPDFYADFRRVTRSVKPDCWTFGEAVDPPDSQLTFEGGMDGALDFMLLEAMRKTFAFGKWTANQFAEFLDRHEAFFPATFTRPSFLDNHDMNRFLWVAHGDIRRLKLAALCQFTLVGTPVIYYGTEVGLSQHNDVMQNGRAIHEEARLPMIWGEEQDRQLFAFYQELIALRKEHLVLRQGTRQTLHASEKLLAYRRKTSDRGLVTVLNIADEANSIELELAESTPVFSTSADCDLQVNGIMKRLVLPPFGGMVLQ